MVFGLLKFKLNTASGYGGETKCWTIDLMLAPCKRIRNRANFCYWNPESHNGLESGIHYGMDSGIQKAGIRNPEAGIRNPGPSWVLLHGAIMQIWRLLININ